MMSIKDATRLSLIQKVQCINRLNSKNIGCLVLTCDQQVSTKLPRVYSYLSNSVGLQSNTTLNLLDRSIKIGFYTLVKFCYFKLCSILIIKMKYSTLNFVGVSDTVGYSETQNSIVYDRTYLYNASVDTTLFVTLTSM